MHSASNSEVCNGFVTPLVTNLADLWEQSCSLAAISASLANFNRLLFRRTPASIHILSQNKVAQYRVKARGAEAVVSSAEAQRLMLRAIQTRIKTSNGGKLVPFAGLEQLEGIWPTVERTGEFWYRRCFRVTRIEGGNSPW